MAPVNSRKKRAFQHRKENDFHRTIICYVTSVIDLTSGNQRPGSKRSQCNQNLDEKLAVSPSNVLSDNCSHLSPYLSCFSMTNQVIHDPCYLQLILFFELYIHLSRV